MNRQSYNSSNKLNRVNKRFLFLKVSEFELEINSFHICLHENHKQDPKTFLSFHTFSHEPNNKGWQFTKQNQKKIRGKETEFYRNAADRHCERRCWGLVGGVRWWNMKWTQKKRSFYKLCVGYFVQLLLLLVGVTLPCIFKLLCRPLADLIS